MEIPVVICDDNKEQALSLKQKVIISEQMLSENDEKNQLKFKIELVNSYQTALDTISKNQISSGIYFLDIELSDEENAKNGIDLAEKIKEIDTNARIIFVTNYQDFAFTTYKRRIGALDFIVKSEDPSEIQHRLNETLEGIITSYALDNEEEKMTYRLGSRIIKLPLKKLYYIETSENPHKLNLVKDTGISIIAGNLTKLAEENPTLLRISQSYLINPQNITAIDIAQNTVSFANGDILKYSRKMRSYMRDWKLEDKIR